MLHVSTSIETKLAIAGETGFGRLRNEVRTFSYNINVRVMKVNAMIIVRI